VCPLGTRLLAVVLPAKGAELDTPIAGIWIADNDF